MKENKIRNVEEKLWNYESPFFNPLPNNSGNTKYRSRSEEIVTDALNRVGISFGYEDELSVEVDTKSGRKENTWHPDFNLKDLGIILEYVGKPDDKEYMEGIKKKEKVYAENGVNVVWIYPEDVWEENGGKYQERPDAEENILNKVYDEMRSMNQGICTESRFKAGSLKYGARSRLYSGA